MSTFDIYNLAEIWNTRDLEDRLDELETVDLPDPASYAGLLPKLIEERQEDMDLIRSVISEIELHGERKCGDGEGISMIADEYFEKYAKGLAYETGLVDPLPRWLYNSIDWSQAAQRLQTKIYTSVGIEGQTFWYRQRSYGLSSLWD